MYPGSRRPGIADALRIGISAYASSCPIPAARAWSTRKVYGMKTANSTKKIARVTDAYGGSLKAIISIFAPLTLLGGNLLLRNTQATTHNPAQMNPIMRIAQPNPILGAKNSMISEKARPPVPPAVQAIPIAKPLRRWKKWPMQETAEVKRQQVLRPPSTPKERMIW